MANTKQAIKMVRKIKRRTQYNRWWKNNIKNAVKDLGVALTAGDKKEPELKVIFQKLQKTIDKAAKNKVIHINKANRMKSSSIKKIFKSINS